MVGERRNLLLAQLVRLPFYFLALTVIFPYYWMATSAFKTVPEIVRNPPSLLVLNPTLKNFSNPDWSPDEVRPDEWQGLLQRFEGLGFLGFFANSLFVTATVTILGLLLASAVAYVLVKHPFPGANLVFLVILGSMMIPWQVTIIPNYISMRDLGWINSYWALIVPSLAMAFAVFFLRQAVLGLPGELFDAARIDGAGEVRIWWSIVLPLLRPAMAAMAILVALGQWNSFLWPLLIVNDDAHSTLPLAIAKLAGTLVSDPKSAGVIMAASLLASIPAVIFFLLFQRQFVQGISVGGVKG